VLVDKCYAYHKCQWEKIDFHIAGCTLCGFVHQCNAETCTQTTQESDALYCNITGYCLKSQNFMACEYDDNCIVYSRKRNVYSGDNVQDLASRISTAMQEVLSISEHTNTVELCKVCTQHACNLLRPCKAHLKMKIKNTDIRQIAIGLLYLMRHGIRVHGVSVLPCISELRTVLPSENDLCRKLDFRAKYITDTENKFKYLFRETSPEQLVALNFHGNTRMW
jgi:hypothetical protein